MYLHDILFCVMLMNSNYALSFYILIFNALRDFEITTEHGIFFANANAKVSKLFSNSKFRVRSTKAFKPHQIFLYL